MLETEIVASEGSGLKWILLWSPFLSAFGQNSKHMDSNGRESSRSRYWSLLDRPGVGCPRKNPALRLDLSYIGF